MVVILLWKTFEELLELDFKEIILGKKKCTLITFMSFGDFSSKWIVLITYQTDSAAYPPESKKAKQKQNIR